MSTSYRIQLSTNEVYGNNYADKRVVYAKLRNVPCTHQSALTSGSSEEAAKGS